MKNAFGNDGIMNDIELVYDVIPEEFVYTKSERKSRRSGGIYKCKNDTYEARVSSNGRDYNLGNFPTREDAQKAIDIKYQEMSDLKQYEPIQRNADGIAFLSCGTDQVLVDDNIFRQLQDKLIRNNEGYIYFGNNMRLSRYVIGAKAGDPHVDHISRDRLDNRLLNLRFVTGSENSQNRTKRADTSSQYVGVSLNRKKWYANIQKDGTVYSQSFDIETMAAEWYDGKALELYGPHAKVNFPVTCREVADEDLQKKNPDSLVIPQKEISGSFVIPGLKSALFKFSCIPLQQRGTIRKFKNSFQARCKFSKFKLDISGFGTEQEAYAKTTMEYYKNRLLVLFDKYNVKEESVPVEEVNLALEPVMRFVHEKILKKSTEP